MNRRSWLLLGIFVAAGVLAIAANARSQASTFSLPVVSGQSPPLVYQACLTDLDASFAELVEESTDSWDGNSVLALSSDAMELPDADYSLCSCSEFARAAASSLVSQSVRLQI